MIDDLLTILNSFKVPVYRQGSMSNDEKYPSTFITFWNNDSPEHAHYDNSEYGTAWSYNIYVYSSDPAEIYNLLAQIKTALKASGWVVPSKGQDVDSDEATHTGRMIEISYLEV